MLEGLFYQLANSTPLSTTAVPSVPHEKPKVEAIRKNGALSAVDQQKILAYLRVIGETDQRVIDGLLLKCNEDAGYLNWMLQWADRLSKSSQHGMMAVTCRGCARFKSLHAHGGGAGACVIGVWTAGYWRWSEDVHQCNKYFPRPPA